MTAFRSWLVPLGLVVGVTCLSVLSDFVAPTSGTAIRLLDGLVVVAALIYGARHNGARSVTAWWVIALGIGAWVTADLMWDLLDIAHVRWTSGWYDIVNVIYLVPYPLIFLAILGVVKAGRKARSIDNVVDSALLFLTIVLLLQVFVVNPTTTAGTKIDLWGAIYPFGDALLLAGMAWVFFTNVRWNASAWLLGAGLLLMLLVDAAWEVSLQFGYASWDPWINPLYPTAYALIAAAVLHPAIGRFGDAAQPVAQNLQPARLGFLCVALGLIPVAAFLGSRDDLLVEVCTVGLVVAIGTRFAALVRDSHNAHRQAATSAERFRNLAAAAPVGILESDAHLRIVFANQATDRILGMSAVGLSVDELIARVDPRDQPLMHEAFGTVVAGDRATAQVRMRDGEGHEMWLAWSGAPVRGGPGPFAGAFVSTVDITALKDAEELLSLQAMHDPLTGLPNRRLLFDRLTTGFARLKRHPGLIAVLFLDLDGFKQVNDRFGHDAGDDLLKVVTSRMLGVVRAQDTVARYGGDEFVVVLDQIAEPSDAMLVAEKIISAIAVPFAVGDGEVAVSASVGIATSGDPHDDPDVLVSNADSVMFEAKEAGTGMIRFFDDPRDGDGRRVDSGLARRSHR